MLLQDKELQLDIKQKNSFQEKTKNKNIICNLIGSVWDLLFSGNSRTVRELYRCDLVDSISP